MTAAAHPALTDEGAVSAPAEIDERRWRLGLVCIGALGLLAGLFAIDHSLVGVAHDDAMYVILARALASGEGYRFLHLPGHPAGTHFPPGYPALLALVSLVAPAFPGNLLVFKGLNAVALAAASVAAALLVRVRFGSTRLGFALGAATACSAPLLILGAMVLSEPLFLALLLPLLVVAERLGEQEGSARKALALGLCIGLAVLVRTHGVALVGALCLVLALRRRWRDAALVFGGAAIVLAPWQLWSAQHASGVPAPLLGNYDSYLAWWVRGVRDMGMAMIPKTLVRTVGESSALLVTLSSPARAVPARSVTLAALAVVGTAGLLVMRRRAPVTALFLIGYLGIVLVWPFTPARFVWGVWPLLLLVGVAAAWWAFAPRPSVPLAMRGVVAASVVWLAVGYALYEVRAVRGQWWRSIPAAGSARIVPTVEWALANTQPGDVLAADDEGAVFLYTGRQTVPTVTFTAQHFLIDRSFAQEAREGLGPILAAYPVRTVIVGSARTFSVAGLLASSPSPLLAPPVHFPGGAAFTVLPR